VTGLLAIDGPQVAGLHPDETFDFVTRLVVLTAAHREDRSAAGENRASAVSPLANDHRVQERQLGATKPANRPGAEGSVGEPQAADSNLGTDTKRVESGRCSDCSHGSARRSRDEGVAGSVFCDDDTIPFRRRRDRRQRQQGRKGNQVHKASFHVTPS